MDNLKKFVHPSWLVYFSDKGESMSDAQNLKGKCVQVAEDVKSHFDAMGPVKEVLHFDAKDIETLAPKQFTPSEINEIVGLDAKANALNGWYSRAIDTKNAIIDVIKAAPMDKFLLEGEVFIPQDFPEKFTELRPAVKLFTEEDITGTWSPNEVADFLLKEQYCATVGKLIHKKGKLHDMYNTPMNVTSKIKELASGHGGNKAYPVTITPMYKDEVLTELKDVYLKKHDEHREMEKKVNWFKAKLKNELTEKNAEAQKVYGQAIAEFNKKQMDYNNRRNSFLQDVNNKNAELQSKCEERRQLTIKDAAGIKIFIPEALREVKEFVQNYTIYKKEDKKK